MSQTRQELVILFQIQITQEYYNNNGKISDPQSLFKSGLIDDMTKSFNMTVFSRFQAANGPSLQKLINVHKVKLKKFVEKVK